MFRFSFATESWTGTTDTKSWKLMPYPKPFEESPARTMSASIRTVGAGEESMAYVHVDLHYPIAALNVPMVKMCLDQGVDVNAKFSDGTTPLMKAVAAAYVFANDNPFWMFPLSRRDARQIVQLLLDHKAEKSPEVWNWTTGRYHWWTRPDWLIEQLLAPSPHPKLCQFISMTDAAWAGEQEELEDMLTQEPELLYVAESHGVSPLGAAVYCNDEWMVDMLLDKGASPLAIAAASNLGVIVRLLLQYGASITVEDPVLGLTPLGYAAREGLYSMCSTLLEHEKIQRPSDKKGTLSKALALAVERGHKNIVTLLVEHGADGPTVQRKNVVDAWPATVHGKRKVSAWLEFESPFVPTSNRRNV